MMATSAGGNLTIIGDQEDETSVSATAEPLKEEFEQESAKIILHFFNQDLKDIENNAVVTTEITNGQAQRLLITFKEARAISVRKLIDKLKTKVRELPQKKIQLDSDKAKEIDNITQKWEGNKEVLILRDITANKVKIVGTTEDLVDKAANKLNHELDIAAGTNKWNMPRQVPDIGRNTQTYASVAAGKKLYPDLTKYQEKDSFDSKASAAGASQSSNDFTRHKPVQSSKNEAAPNKFSSGYGFNFEAVLKGGLVLKVYKASITQLKVDAIVNAANDTMMHGGGVARVISEAAGYDLDRESADYVQKNGPVKVSKNIVSTAGYLPYKGVIHAVGPVWHEYREKDRCLKDLYKCVWNILTRCEMHSYEKVAMSAISSGIFAVPKPLCADMYVKAAVDFSEKIKEGEYAYPKEFHIIDVDTSILQLVKESVEKWQKHPSSLDLEVSLEKYFKDNPHSTGYSGYPVSRNSGQRNRGQRPKGHGKGQEYNSSQAGNKMNDEGITGTYKLACTLERKEDQTFAWGGIAKVYDFDKQITIKMFKGEIVKSRGVDAVVCAINKSLQASGYLHESLKKKAGYDFETSFKKMVDVHKNSAKPLDVIKCASGNLGVSNIIYIVMERVLDGDDKETQTYQEAIRRVLSKARDWQLEKLVIPMFGTGNIQKNRNKLKKCCTALLKGIDSFIDDHGNKSRVREIHLVNNSDLVCSLLEEVFNEGASHYQSADPGSNSKKSPSRDDGIGASGQSDNKRHRGSSRKTFTKDGMEENNQPQEENTYSEIDPLGSLSFSDDRRCGDDNASGQRKPQQSETGREIPKDSAQKRASNQSVPNEEVDNQEPSSSTEQQGNLKIIEM